MTARKLAKPGIDPQARPPGGVLQTCDGYHVVDSDRTSNAAFTISEYQARVAAVQAVLQERALDGLLVHTPENIYYLTGYETSGYFEYQVLILPAVGEPSLLIRNVERLNVDEYSWLPGAYIWKDGTDYLECTKTLVRAIVPGRRLGLERHSWFVTAEIADGLAAHLPEHDLISAGRIIETIRLVKTDAEIAYIREAADLADTAMRAAIEAAAAGASELDVAAAAYEAQIRAGAEYPALPHYVSSGYRTHLGHAHWSSKELIMGELLKLEILGTKRRYHAGLTRPSVIGQPSRELRADADLCIAVQDSTLASLRPGASVDELTRTARAAFEGAGRTAVTIRLGYSMGIGFPPVAGEGQTADFREGASWELRPGMVFHMLSVMSVGLVISDTVLITADGHERLTKTERTLFEV